MRIAIDGSSIGQDPSGARTRFVHLLRAYAKLESRHDVVVFAPQRARLEYAFAGHEVECVRVPDAPPPWRRALRGASVWDRLLRSVRADLFQAETLPVPRVSVCPMTLTLHDLRDLEPGSPLGRRLFAKLALPAQLRRVARVIAVSKFTARQLRDRLRVPSDLLRVVENAPDAELTRITDAAELRRVRERWNLPSRYVLALGHLEHRKGLDRLVIAMGELHLRDGMNHVGLVLAGHDREAIGPRLETAAHAYGVRMVRTGAVTDAERAALLSQASVLAIPSRVEGFGIVPLEAMKVGVPVVYARESALPDTIGDAGVGVNADDATAFADALERVLSDDALRNELLARGSHRVAGASWEDSARALHEVWNGIERPGA